MKQSITHSTPLKTWKCLFTIILILGMSFSSRLLAQCQGFFVTVDTDPPYLTYCPNDTVVAFPIITGGTGPFTYEWSSGGTDSLDVVLAPNDSWYTLYLTLTDANGCVAYSSKHIKPIFWNLNGYTSGAACEGESVNLSVSASGPDHTYLWSNGETANPISVTDPGTYTVTVTNTPSGCTDVIELTPEFIPNPTPEIIGPATICNGQLLSLELTEFYSQYSWDPSGESTPTIEINGPGTYAVTVTNFNGCTGTDGIEVLYVSGTMPQLQAAPQLCPEDIDIVEVLNSGDFASILWSTGESGPSISAVAPETYAVTVTDLDGCIETGEISIALFTITNPFINGDIQFCFEEESVTFTVTPSFSQYAWSTGEDTESITVNTPDTYTVTVTDANGCTTVGTHQLTAAPDPYPYILVPPPVCSDDPIVLQVTGSAGPYVAYEWSSGEASPFIQVFGSGTYTVMVTNTYGCTEVSEPVDVILEPPPTADIATAPYACNGAFTLTASGGGTYAWSTSDTSAVINVQNSGSYTVTVTNAAGCTATAVDSVTVPFLPTVEITGIPVFCFGDTSNLSTNPGFEQYLWTTGDTIPDIAVAQSGTYTVTVTDVNGCSAIDSLVITAAPLPVPDVSGAPGFCSGESVDIALNQSFFEILWSTGDTTQNITVTAADTFSVVVTTAFGCTATDEWVIAEFPLPSVTITGPSSICTGNTATLSVPDNYSQIEWSTGETSPNITISLDGAYDVIVTDSNGCMANDLHLVEISDSLNPVIVVMDFACDGSATLDAGLGYNTYLWSNNDTTAAITVLDAGTYSVTVNDQGGCYGVDALTVTMPPPPQVAISGSSAACADTLGTLVANAGFSAYSWSNGETTESINISQSGNYTVVATDADGCTATASQSFESYPLPLVEILGPDSICPGGIVDLSVSGNYSQILWNTGETSATISTSQIGIFKVVVIDNNGCTATDLQTLVTGDSLSAAIDILYFVCEGYAILDAGPGYATYLWSNDSTTATITASGAGSYSVTVSDPNGCIGEDIASIAFPNLPQVDISGIASVCEGNFSTLNASPGFAYYTWSNGETTQSINVSQAGTYSVEVIDANGCMASDSQSFNLFTLPLVDISGPASICTGSSAILSVSGNYSQIAWNTGETGPSISVSQNGTFEVVVTDNNGCTASDLQVVEIGDNLSPVITVLTASCDGTAMLDAGAGYATYLWSNGATTSAIKVTASGTYSVTVSDLGGCSGEEVASLSIPVPPQVNISGPAASCEDTPGTLVAEAGFPSYVWSNGATTQSILVAQSGNYTVFVTDANGCTATANQLFEAYPLPVVEVSGPGFICVGNSATLTVSGNFPQITWSTGETGNSISVSQSGIYSAAVTDLNGCTANNSLAVEVGTALIPAIAVAVPACAGTATLDASAGFAGYLWSNGSTTASIMVAVSGTYSVTVSDANGCTGEAFASVNIPQLPQASISGPAASCEDNPGTLLASSGFSAYAWSNGETTQSISVSQSGIYTVVVTDVNGCTTTANQSFEAFPLPIVDVSGPGAICPNDNASILASGNYSQITWNTGETSNSIKVSQGGLYTVQVTDLNGCTASNEWFVTQLQIDYTFLQIETCSIQDTGTTELLLSNQFGCDSVITISAVLAPALTTDVTLQVCSGENAVFNGTQLAAGTSGLFIFNAANGCDSLVTVTVDELPPVAFELSPTAACQNSFDGTIEVAIQGGTAPFLYTLNGQDSQSDGTFTDLSSDLHSVLVTDANGCTLEKTVAIPESIPTEIVVEAQELSCEENTVLLQPTVVSGDPAQITWNWSNGSTQPWVMAETPGNYNVQVDDGCTVKEYTIAVNWATELLGGDFFYVPNVFSPNHDGRNELFKISPRPDVTIFDFEFKVFDRWGNLMFDTSNTDDSWDGIFQGKEMQPGVYVWYIKAKVKLCEMRNFKIFKKGDVTIYR